MFGHPQEVTIISKEYLRLLSFSTLPFMLFMAAKQFSDGLSYTKAAVYVTIIGVSVNVFLNWLLIYGHLNCPQLGIIGSGIATMSARTIMAVLMFGYILTNGNLRKYVPSLSENISTLKATIRVFKIGIPSGMQLFFEIGAFTAAAIIVGRIGVAESAAHQIGISLAAIATMLATGISVAGSIRVGNAVGEKNIVKVKQAGNTALILAACCMLITATIFLGFTEQLVYLFNKTDKNLITVAVSVLMIAGFFQISDGLQVVSLGILRGVSDVNIPTIFTLVAYWGIGLPVGYLLGFYYNMGVKGIWIGLLFGLSTSAILLVARFYRITRAENQAQLFKSVAL
jgi:MATE family multidrug resistance protein